ncbi:MAG TPA: S9 family peptidase [Candidatus Baltobacteraceae bacterium]
MRKFLAAFCFAVCCAAPAMAASVAPEDLFKMTYLSSALISPDGTHVLVESSKMDGPKNTYDRSIELVDAATGNLTHNVTKHLGDGDYDWMPDGKSFVFVRTMPKQKPQLYRYTLATETVVQLTHVKEGVSGPVVSHDGKRIALTVTQSDPPHAAYIDFAKAGFTPKADQKNTDIRTIGQLFFQVNGAGYVYQDHQHIWTVDADGSSAKAITSGQYSEGFAAWSPDDRTMLFSSTRYEPVDGADSDVYTIPSTGGAMQKMSSSLPANFAVSFSNDGSRLYYLTQDVKDGAALPALAVAKPDGSDAKTVVAKNTASWGDSLLADMKEGGGFCVNMLPSSDWALLNVDGPGYSNLRILDLSSGTFRDATPPKGEAWSCSVSHDGKRVAYLYSDFTHPADVYVTDVVNGTPRQLTHVNDDYLKSATLSTPQEFTVKDSLGNTVQAWFMPATGGKPGAKHPTLLNIHGGPETQFGDTFFQEFQVYASMGYNVVFSDPAGSTGHGYALEEALEGNYGDAMFQGVQAVMDAAVQRPDVDATRLGVSGGSYGGYATMWVVAHTDRYKAGVAERGVSNLVSENLAADFAGKGGLGGGYYTWGPAWNPASTDYAKFSPLTYVEGVHTPLMLLHSDEDTRAPIDQTLQEYTSLKVLGQTVEYVAVPNENHDLNRTGSPIHRVERLHIMLDWLGKYLNP